MNEIEGLIDQTLSLCKRLDEMSYNEKKFCIDLCVKLEVWSWELLRMCDCLKNFNQER